MQDRAPTKPNRYAVYDDSHNFLRYEYHERADEPTQAGTALNKATFLSDLVAALYGKDASATPNDIFALIQPSLAAKSKYITGSYVGTGTATKTLVIGFDAELVLVFGGESDSFMMFQILKKSASRGYSVRTQSTVTNATAINYPITSWGNDIIFTASTYDFAMNASGKTYQFIAFSK